LTKATLFISDVVKAGFYSMKFFISAEIYGDVNFRETRKTVERKLNSSLKEKSYGNCLKEISLIPIVISEYFVLKGVKERRLFQRKTKSADYRLFIDYNKFRTGDKRMKELLLINNIVCSIEDLTRKAKGEFLGKELIDDILGLFQTSLEELKKL
jgi:hypothetical protein